MQTSQKTNINIPKRYRQILVEELEEQLEILAENNAESYPQLGALDNTSLYPYN